MSRLNRVLLLMIVRWYFWRNFKILEYSKPWLKQHLIQCCNSSLSSQKGTLHIKVCDYGEEIIWRDVFLPSYMTFPRIHLKKRLKFSKNYQTKLRALYTLECRNSNFLTIFCNMTHNSERIFQYFSTKFCPFIPKV